MTFPPKNFLAPRRTRRHRAIAVPYRYDRRRPAWVPLSLIINGLLMSWWGQGLVRLSDPVPQPGPALSPTPTDLALADLALADLALNVSANASANASAAPVAARPTGLTYEQWVEQLGKEAIALQNTQNLSILAGDSLSLWFPDKLLPHDQRWLNQGISGETSQGLRRRLGLWQQLKPKRIFIMIGINDLLKGNAPEAVLGNQRQIIRDLRKAHPNSAVVVQSLLPHGGSNSRWEGRTRLGRIPNDKIREFNRQLAAIAQAEGAYYLDLHPLFSDDQGFLRQELTTDGLHLNGQGYLVWSTAINFFSLQRLSPETSPPAATLGLSRR